MNVTISNKAKFGTEANYTEFASDGTMKAMGNATTFDDSMVPPTVFRTGGTALTLAELVSGIYMHRFDTTDEIQFSVQFPHTMKVNSVIYPHIHLINKDAITGAANVTFSFVWTWANIGSSFPAVTSDNNVVTSFADADALSHKVKAFAAITPTTGQGNISSILIGKLTRENTGYTANNIFLGGFDIHIEVDTLGSALEYTK